MATNKEKEELLEILKFTPRTYRISMWGYGGEKVMGTVPREVWDYCMENSVDLSDIAWSDESTVEDDMKLDLDKLPFYPGQWYECDNMAHVSGVSRDSGTLQIEDENSETVFEQSLDALDGCDGSPDLCCNDEVWIGQEEAGKVVFVGNSNEKGTFFEGEIELRAPFQIEKLSLHYDEIDGEEIVNAVYYDGEEIDNFGGSTDGKSSDFTMCLVGEDGKWTRYEPEEKDWGHPEYGTSPEGWERSPKFDFKKHKPVHAGYYSVNWCYGSTYGSLYWDGKEFGEWEYGKFNPVDQKGIKTWSGYNWDTSSWANRPPEPPDLICTNTTCSWVGRGDDRRTDDNYDDHCPECDGTEFNWIDYDPDTKEGRANREQYCYVGDVAHLEAALEELKAEFEALCADDEDELKLINCACKGCAWEGPIDDTLNNEHDEMVCPECKSRVDIISEEGEE